VSLVAGDPYRERLFALPKFLLGAQNATSGNAEVAAGLRLTGHFLLERLLHPHGREMPSARLQLDGLAARES
jgi:DNA repair protein RecO (recombination protein O)